MLRLDENIKKDVVDQLYWDSRVNAADIQVNVSEGQVTLNGSVSSHNSRLSAESDAWLIGGVIAVDNNIDVDKPKKPRKISDEEIQDRLEKILFWDADIDDTNIAVDVSGGRVSLAGSVDAYWKKWEAEKKISGIYGLTEIDNQLTIVPTENILDKVIAKNILDALKRNLYINAEDVIVKVEDGIVTLTGSVPGWFIRSQVQEVVAFTDGVVDVINKLNTE